MAWAIGAIKHRNWYAMIEIYNDVIFVVKLLVAKKIFKKMLNYSLGDNTKTPNIDLF